MKILYLLLTIFLFVSCSNNPASNEDLEKIESSNSDFSKDIIHPTINSGPTSGFDYLLPPFTSFNYLNSDPYGVNRSYVNGVQGLANDGTNWYLSNKENIYKWNGSAGFPSSISGTSNYKYVGMLIGGGYDHYGDIDFDEDQNLLYVPLEKSNKSKKPLLVVLNSNLAYVDSTILFKNAEPQYNNEVPWVSIDPISKKIYTSKFNNVSELWIYTDTNTGTGIDLASTVEVLQLKNSNGQPLTLDGIQGGEFSKSGHLFLLVQDGCNDGTEGVYIFDVKTGKLQDHEDDVKCEGSSQEFEGITVWDFDNNSNNGGFTGQVHALNYENHWYHGKKFWLKHLRVTGHSTEVITPQIVGTVINGKPHLEWDSMGSGYGYEIYEENTAPNGGNSLYATTSATSITINKILDDPNISGIFYPLRYYIRAKKNNLLSDYSNKVFFTIEYDDSSCGGGRFCFE